MEGKLKAILRVSLALTMALSLGLLVAPPAAGATSSREFPDPGVFEFTVPEEATSITVETWGSGGAGGGSTNGGFLSARCGAGGGGGAYAVTLDVEPGDELVVVVGAGGAGVSGGNGHDGDPSFVGPDANPDHALVLAGGGSGGTANTAGGKPLGGPGGQGGGSHVDYVEAGDDGERGATCFTSVSGAGGAGAFGGGSGGASRTGADISADGNPGNALGGGGGGARTSQFDGERAGGDGAKGRVLITWEGPVEPVCPTISPTTAEYDLANPDAVTTTITWNDATSITSIHDGVAYLTPSADYTVVGNTLTILNSYLAGELTAVDDSAMLTITFDICSPIIFTITAIDTTEEECADLAPTTGQYDLANPGNLTWTITWNDTSSITSIHDGSGYLAAGTDYTVVGNTLTILNAYLAGKLTEAGGSVVLTINCDICAIPLTITAIDTDELVCPTISPTTAEYDLASPNNVATTITWNDATSITSIHDGVAYLTLGADYTVVGNTLTILNSYLAGELTAVDDSAMLTITFDICTPVPFTITAIDTTGQICPTISPTTAQYDLAHPNDVTTTITWNDATSLDSVEDDVGPLPAGFHYTVVGNTLTIMNTYLAGKLTTVGESVVLIITFDICAPVYLTIRAIDTELPVGLTGYPVNKLAVMAPWIVLGAAIIVGGSLLALKRRRRT